MLNKGEGAEEFLTEIVKVYDDHIHDLGSLFLLIVEKRRSLWGGLLCSEREGGYCSAMSRKRTASTVATSRYHRPFS